jgi:hypothetical protein
MNRAMINRSKQLLAKYITLVERAVTKNMFVTIPDNRSPQRNLKPWRRGKELLTGKASKTKRGGF